MCGSNAKKITSAKIPGTRTFANPRAATVFDADALAEQGINTILDLQRVAPSLAINSFNRSTFVNIRGVGIAQSAPTSNPGVAYYIDGVLIPHEQFIGQSFFDVGAVEVLRSLWGDMRDLEATVQGFLDTEAVLAAAS